MSARLMLEAATGRPLDEINVAEAMHPGVLTCTVDTTLRDVARTMAAYRVHAVIVLGSDDGLDTEPAGRLWGVVADLDLVSAAALGELDQTAGAMAVTPVVLVDAQHTLQHAAQLMREHEVAHLVVTDRASFLPVGVISTLDLARAIAIAP